MSGLGPIGRLGAWTAGHVRLVVAAWVVIAVGLGAFAPWAEEFLSHYRGAQLEKPFSTQDVEHLLETFPKT